MPGLERLFHATILTRMKGHDGDTSTGIQAGWQAAQESIQSAELFVHGNPHGLKNTPDRLLDEFDRSVLQRSSNGVGQVCRGRKVFAREG